MGRKRKIKSPEEEAKQEEKTPKFFFDPATPTTVTLGCQGITIAEGPCKRLPNNYLIGLVDHAITLKLCVVHWRIYREAQEQKRQELSETEGFQRYTPEPGEYTFWDGGDSWTYKPGR